MRRTWPFLIVVAVAGGAAGVAIAGRPESADRLIIDRSASSTSTTRQPSTSSSVVTAASDLP